MTSKMLYAAESWERVYTAFEQINFTAYDYDAVKQSLLDYLKLNYPESFNDYIESSQLIALIETFAYMAEQLAYRVDMSVHENMLPTAQRKQNILRLAKLISYTASRNLPLRGLVKVTSISTSESITDSQGNLLTNKVINWADSNNSLWKEQFFLALNRVTTNAFGSPSKVFQVDSTVFQQYELQNVLDSEVDGTAFVNGTLPLKLTVNGSTLKFELVPADIDSDGVFERSPNPKSYFNLLYANDGFGDSSDMTGFMMYMKQGTLSKLQYTFDTKIPNRVVEISQTGINDVDVWLQEVTAAEDIIKEWEPVENINGLNLAYNTISGTKKYEIETLEDDAIRLVFGSGDFSAIPTGYFNIWVRSSESGGMTVSKEDLVDYSVTFAYTSKQGKRESCTMTVSLISALQNSAVSEDIEHIRTVAPSVHYSQNRMVNGQDYNSFMMKDSSILKLKTVNRTFAGQPKYLDWNDASGTYQNVKIFGDDMRMYYDMSSTASTSRLSSRSVIDQLIEPALSDPGVYNLLVYSFYQSASPLNLAYVRPRVSFIENAALTIDGVKILEKTELQGALDRHWYGEPSYLVSLGPDLTTETSPKTYYGVVTDDTDGKVYDSSLKLVTVDSSSNYVLSTLPGAVSGMQEAVTKQKRFGIKFNPDRPFASNLQIGPASETITSSSTLTSSDIVQASAVTEAITVEIVDADTGTFTVVGSKSGILPTGIVGTPYTNGLLSFIVDFPAGLDTTLVVGDAFIINIVAGATLTPTVYKQNLLGRFEVIDEHLLTDDVETMSYDVTDDVASWVILLERNDNSDGSLSYWRMITRNFRLIIESPTTRFWYNNDAKIVDSETKLTVTDTVKLLKSNLYADSSKPLGTDQAYDVVGTLRYTNGDVNINALQVTPTATTSDYMPSDGRPQASLQFLNFIGTSKYVYFSIDSSTGKLTPVTATTYLETLTYTDDVADNIYARKLGREDLDFAWIHYAPSDNLIDPSPSNIHDTYILTRGYYSRMLDWLNGTLTTEPVAPTSFELRTSYRSMLASKMLSDAVVLHPAKIKLLFGDKAAAELRAKFKIVKASGSSLTDDQLRIKTLDIISSYFDIAEWDFGTAFYATELLAVIHQKLATDIASVVLVPEFPTNYYGDLLYIEADSDEILMPAAELKDIVVISGLDKTSLRQK
jgi:hypothetical protein